jgi:hypothetical protein
MTNRYQGVDPILSQVSIGYQNSAYIADQLFPTVGVKKQSGKHFIYDKGAFRAEDTGRGPGARSKEVTHNLTTGLPYFAEDHALKEFVADEDVDNAAEGVDPYVDATVNVTEKLFIGKEIELATALTDTAVMTQNDTLSGTDQWSDYDNSDPVADIRAAKQAIHQNIHIDANTLVLGKQVVDKLVDHPAIIERVKYSQLGILNTDLLARFFDVERVIVGAAGKNTAKEGQTDSMSYIWGKHAILAYINPRVGQKSITLGTTYRWKTRVTERLNGTDERDRRGQFIRVGDDYYDQKLVAAEAGYLLKNVVA